MQIEKPASCNSSLDWLEAEKLIIAIINTSLKVFQVCPGKDIA